MDLPIIPFVRESEKQRKNSRISGKDDSVSSSNSVRGELSGSAAKLFYESLTKFDEVSTANVQPSQVPDNQVRKKCYKKIVKRRRNILKESDFFKAAENGDCDTLEEMILEGFVVDTTDRYGWTALMIAACAGKEDAVKMLIDRQANRSITTTAGETVYDLVLRKGLKGLYNVLCTYGFKSEDSSSSDGEVAQSLAYTCQVCHMTVSSSRQQHETSVVHLMNVKREASYPNYSIPESNRGFQMMVKSGWDKDGGLGPEGKGKQFPIKTVLKRDREGLGSSSKHVERITHFQPRDTKAVEDVHKTERQEKTSTLKRKYVSRKEIKDKEKTKAFRREFY